MVSVPILNGIGSEEFWQANIEGRSGGGFN